MPVYAETRQNLRRRIQRAFGDLVATSGSLALPSVNGFFAPELVFSNANQIRGAEVSFFQGGGASLLNSARIIDAATPYSATSGSLYAQIRVLQPWTAAPSTNSGWEVTRLFRRQQYEDAISQAVRRVVRRVLVPTEEFLVVNSWIRNPMFSGWRNGDSGLPDYWTVTGSGATYSRITEQVHRSPQVARLAVPASTLTYFEGEVIDGASLVGETVTLSVLARAGIASRVSIVLQDSSLGEVGKSSYHAGTSGAEGVGLWRELSITNVAIPSNARDLTVRLQVESGAGANNVDWTQVQVNGGDRWIYQLCHNFAYIQDVYVSSADGDWLQVPREWWYVSRGYTRSATSGDDAGYVQIGFLKDFWAPSTGDLLRVVGQRYASDPAEADNVPIDPEYMFNRAAADLYNLLPGGSTDWQGQRSRATEWERRAQEAERRVRTRVWLGSKPARDD